jgi:hypothetical protein
MQNVPLRTATSEKLERWNKKHAKIAVVLLFTVCWLASCLVRASSEGELIGVDPSWLMGLATSFQQGLISGRDIHFTYGPLAQVLAWFATGLTASKSAFDGYRMICFVFFSLSPLIIGLVFLLLPQVSAIQTALIYTFLLLLNSFGEVASFRAALLILAAVLPFRILAGPPSRQMLSACGLALFCFACQLITLDIGVYSAAVSLAILVIAHFRHLAKDWHIPAVFVAFLAGLNLLLAVFFKATSAAYAGVFDYQRYAFETIRGYNSTMGVDWEFTRFKTFLLICVVVYTIAFGIRAVRRSKDQDRYLIAGLLGVSLLALKSAMVRSDTGHIVLAAAPFILVFLLLCNTRWNTRRGLYLWSPLAVSLFWIVPMAGLAAPREIWAVASSTRSPGTMLRDMSSVPIPIESVLPQSILQSVARVDRRPLLAFPYENYLPIALKRPLVAPVLQSYGALTSSLQSFYVHSLENLRTPPQVIYAVDEIGAWPIDGVQTITRVPQIFEYLYRNFALAEPGETPDGHYILEQRPRPRGVMLVNLSNRKERNSDTSGRLRLDAPASCGLIALQMTIRASARSVLFRPTGVQLTFRLGEGIIRTAAVRPLQFNVPFTTYVSLLEPRNFYQLFQDSPIAAKLWDGIQYERARVDRISARPTLIDIDSVQCVNPQSFIEAETPNEMTQVAPLSIDASGPLITGYAILKPEAGDSPKWTARMVRLGGGLQSFRDTVVARPATRHRVMLRPALTNTVGIALVNPHAEPIDVEIVRESGGNVQRTVLRLAGWEHRARLLSELFPASAEVFQDSSISIASAKSVALAVTRFSGAQFQVVDDDAEEDAKAPLLFPQFANGAGWGTAFILSNSSDSVAKGRLQLLADDGKPLSVKMNGIVSSEFRYVIAPGRDCRFEPGDGPAGAEQ